jgi:predicted peptidase
MERAFSLASAFAILALMTGCATMGREAETTKPSYKTVTEGFDWGPAISKIIVDAGQEIRSSSIDKDDFSVSVVRTDPATGATLQDLEDWATMKTHDSTGDRAVTAAYLCDASGAKSAARTGRYLALELKVGPSETLSSPFSFDMKKFLNNYVDLRHSIALGGGLKSAKGSKVESIVLGPEARKGNVNLLADDFDTAGLSEYADPTYGKIALHYASYAPAADGKKHPLVIWLHGAGEGGTDPYILLLGNRVTTLVSAPIQKIFGGAYVLAPQSPIVWMNNGAKSYPEDGSTQYLGAVKDLIDSYVAANKDIDPKRIYVGGCSNGGFMTMALALSYPGFFAAAYPSCEAYQDKWISDAQIQGIKDLPIWFIQAKTDRTVDPESSALPSYKRLLAAGAKNVHFSFWDKVEDLSGLYTKAGGAPYEYNGHWSWIYALDNACTKDFDGSAVLAKGKAVSIMEWLAAQSK